MRTIEMTLDEIIEHINSNYHPVVSHKLEGDTLTVIRRDGDTNSREWDNLGTIYSNSRTYDPDGHSINELGDSYDYIMKNLNANYVWRKVYVYDHSGITVRTGDSNPFSCPFDSGLFGIIAVSKEKVRKEFGAKIVHKALRKRVESYLDGEIENLDKDYTGETFGYQVYNLTRNEEDPDLYDDYDEVDSCWGFYCEEEEVYNEI